MGGYSRDRKHLTFKKCRREVGKKTDRWLVGNREGHHLARVVYRPGWRRYVTRFGAGGPTIDFDAECHRQAAEFCDKQTAKLKATWKKRKEARP